MSPREFWLYTAGLITLFIYWAIGYKNPKQWWEFINKYVEYFDGGSIGMW